MVCLHKFHAGRECQVCIPWDIYVLCICFLTMGNQALTERCLISSTWVSYAGRCSDAGMYASEYSLPDILISSSTKTFLKLCIKILLGSHYPMNVWFDFQMLFTDVRFFLTAVFVHVHPSLHVHLSLTVFFFKSD